MLPTRSPCLTGFSLHPGASFCWLRGLAIPQGWPFNVGAVTPKRRTARYTIQYCTILHYTILYYTILYYTILYYTILYYTMLYYTTLYYIMLYCLILYYTTLYCDVLYYDILCYILFFFIIQIPFRLVISPRPMIVAASHFHMFPQHSCGPNRSPYLVQNRIV